MRKFFFRPAGAGSRCSSYLPGHQVDPVQYFKPVLEPSLAVAVTDASGAALHYTPHDFRRTLVRH